MRDIVFLATMIAFFAFFVLLVRLCDRMIGADDAAAVSSEADEQGERIATRAMTTCSGRFSRCW